MDSNDSLLVTPAQAATMLGLDGVSKHPDRVVRSLAKQGLLQARRVSKYIMITRESVEQYVRANK